MERVYLSRLSHPAHLPHPHTIPPKLPKSVVGHVDLCECRVHKWSVCTSVSCVMWHFTMLLVCAVPPLSLHLHSQRGLSKPGGGHLFAPEMKYLNLCGMLHSNYHLVHVQIQFMYQYSPSLMVCFTWRGLLPSPLGSSSPRVPSSAIQSRPPKGEACM